MRGQDTAVELHRRGRPVGAEIAHVRAVTVPRPNLLDRGLGGNIGGEVQHWRISPAGLRNPVGRAAGPRPRHA